MPAPQWAARCECYKGHNSSSGRCNERNVTDDKAQPGHPVLCYWCRLNCTAQHGITKSTLLESFWSNHPDHDER